MANVNVEVLAPFGNYKVGPAEIDEKRIPFLLKHSYIRFSGEEGTTPQIVSSPEKSPVQPVNSSIDLSRLNQSLDEISKSVKMERYDNESIEDYIERLSILLSLEDSPSETDSVGSVDDVKDTDRVRSYWELMYKEFNKAQVDILKDFCPTPQDVQGQSLEALKNLRYIGEATALRMIGLTESFLNGQLT